MTNSFAEDRRTSYLTSWDRLIAAACRKGKEDAQLSRFYDLCFAKRAAVKLYYCEQDPDQVDNLAGDPRHSETIGKLRGQLITYLQKTDDPRFTDAAVEFDDYPNRGRYLKPYLKKHGY